MYELIQYYGLPVSGGNYRYFQRLIKQWGLSTVHWDKPPRNLVRCSDAEILVFDRRGNGSRETPKRLKKAFASTGVEEVCVVCRLPPRWNGKPLRLQVDHINGIPYDNRVENLRWLCPNCHTQTDNYAGKAASKPDRRKYCVCGQVIGARNNQCGSCRKKCRTGPLRPQAEKANWPSDEELKAELLNTPATSIASRLGVTSTALKKRCNRRGIPTPPRGFWAKVKTDKT